MPLLLEMGNPLDWVVDHYGKSAAMYTTTAIIVSIALPGIKALLEMLSSFGDVRRMQAERLRLENAKLRLEIEALRKQHGFESSETKVENTAAKPEAADKHAAGAAKPPPLEYTQIPKLQLQRPQRRPWSWIMALSKHWPRGTATLLIVINALGLLAVTVVGLVAGTSALFLLAAMNDRDVRIGRIWLASSGNLFVVGIVVLAVLFRQLDRQRAWRVGGMPSRY